MRVDFEGFLHYLKFVKVDMDCVVILKQEASLVEMSEDEKRLIDGMLMVVERFADFLADTLVEKLKVEQEIMVLKRKIYK